MHLSVASARACAELFVHYGDKKARNYEPGLPAKELFKHEIPPHELPSAHMPRDSKLCRDAWRER